MLFYFLVDVFYFSIIIRFVFIVQNYLQFNKKYVTFRTCLYVTVRGILKQPVG